MGTMHNLSSRTDREMLEEQILLSVNGDRARVTVGLLSIRLVKCGDTWYTRDNMTPICGGEVSAETTSPDGWRVNT